MRRIGLGLFIIGITFAKAYGQEDYGPVNTGAANYLTIPADARSAAMGGVGVAAVGGGDVRRSKWGGIMPFFIMVRQLYRM